MRVRRPRSDSSFATHPPLIPEPTTMASKSMALSARPERGRAADFVQRQAAAPGARHQLETQLLSGADFRVVVTQEHHLLELAIGRIVAGDALLVVRTHQLE